MNTQEIAKMFESLKKAVANSTLKNIPLHIFSFIYQDHEFVLYRKSGSCNMWDDVQVDTRKYVLKFNGRDIPELNQEQKKAIYDLCVEKKALQRAAINESFSKDMSAKLKMLH